MEKKVQLCFIPDCTNTSSESPLFPFLIDTEDINAWIVGMGSPELMEKIPEDDRRVCKQYFLCTDHLNFLGSIKTASTAEKEQEEEAIEGQEVDNGLDEESSPNQLSQQLSTLTVSQPQEEPEDLEAGWIEPPNPGNSDDYVELKSLSSQDFNSMFSLIPEDVSNVCRLCGKNTEDSISIFSADEGDEISLLEKIRYYLPIKLEDQETLPKVICRECNQLLEKSHDLAMTSLATEALLTGSVPRQELIEKSEAVEAVETAQAGFDDLVTSTQAEDKRNEGNCSQETVSDAMHLPCSQRSLITSDEDETPFTIFGSLKQLKTYDRKRPSCHNAREPAVKRKRLEPIFETWYKCNMCAASSTNLEVIKFHKNRHRLRKPVLFWCNFCDTEFPKESIFANHVLSVHKEESRGLSQAHKCITCHRVFSLMATAVIHFVVRCAVHPVQDYASKKCSEDVYIRYAYTCEFCWKGYAYVSSLNLHRNQEHPGRNSWTGGLDMDETEKKERAVDIFGIKTAFACKFCAKIFTSFDNFILHGEEHADELFKCTTCDKTFSTYEDFKQHRETQHEYRVVLREVSIEEQNDENQVSSFECDDGE